MLQKRSTLTLLHVTFNFRDQYFAGWQQVEETSAKMSSSKTFFLVNSVYTNNSLKTQNKFDLKTKIW